MDCLRAEKEIILNHTSDRQVAEHLCECEECREIARSLEKLISLQPKVEKYNVPKSLDKSITSEAQAFIKERTGQFPAVRKEDLKVRSFHTRAVVLACVACFIIVASIIIIVLPYGKNSAEAGNSGLTAGSGLSPEARDWDKLDMSDEFFILKAGIEIDFAALSLADEDDESEINNEDIEENPLEFLESTI